MKLFHTVRNERFPSLLSYAAFLANQHTGLVGLMATQPFFRRGEIHSLGNGAVVAPVAKDHAAMLGLMRLAPFVVLALCGFTGDAGTALEGRSGKRVFLSVHNGAALSKGSGKGSILRLQWDNPIVRSLVPFLQVLQVQGVA